MTTRSRVAGLLGAAVRLRDVRVGTVTAVLGDGAFERVIDLEVPWRNQRRRFLPWVRSGTRTARSASRPPSSSSRRATWTRMTGWAALVIRDPGAIAGLEVDAAGRLTRSAEGVSVSGAAAPGTSRR